jgi:HEAT repeat protein
MYGSSRRLAMYPLGHPTTQEALKKPLNALNEIFSFKHSFVIEFFRGRLLAEGILLDDSVYDSGMALELKKHKLSNVVFASGLSLGELYHFLSVLVSKPGPYEDDFSRILKAKNVASINVNVEKPATTFYFEASPDRSIGQQFMLLDRIKIILSEKPGIIAQYYLGKLKGDDEIAEHLGIDLRLSFLTKFFRESLMKLDPEKGLQLIEQTVLSTNWLDDSLDSQAVLGMRRLFDDFLAENKDEEIISRIYKLLKKIGTPDSIMTQVFNKSSFLKLKALQESETIVDVLRYSDPAQIEPASLKKTAFKLAASGQKLYLQDLLEQLIRGLSAPTIEQRQKSAALVVTAADVLSNGGFFDEFHGLCKELIRMTLLPTETIEPVEITSELLWLALKNNRWPEFKALGRTLRGVSDDHLQSEAKRELAVSKLTEISTSDLLFKTASTLAEQGKSDEANGFFEGLSSLGSRDIIKLLAGKLTHPDINIRSRMIKLLVAMKKDSGIVLTDMLAEMVAKVSGGFVSEEDWYYFRNILRVLRDVRAEEALPQLEIMLSWPNARIKLEVIKTLESMPAESAGKLLAKLSKDENIEVRKSAVVAAGLIGDSSLVPFLREQFTNDPQCRHIIPATLGRIGTPEARDALIELFESKEIYKTLNISKKDSDEIRATILKALSIIGDASAMKKLAEYSNMSFDKSLFKKDLLSNTAKIILSGKLR